MQVPYPAEFKQARVLDALLPVSARYAAAAAVAQLSASNAGAGSASNRKARLGTTASEAPTTFRQQLPSSVQHIPLLNDGGGSRRSKLATQQGVACACRQLQLLRTPHSHCSLLPTLPKQATTAPVLPAYLHTPCTVTPPWVPFTSRPPVCCVCVPGSCTL